MKPIAIIRHVAYEGPGYLGQFLDARNIPWQLIAVDQGEPIPNSMAAFSGLVLMGGPMSVNDPLPWIAPELDLICQAHAANMPVLGHCLGGQLISKALGATVSVNAVKEIGWGSAIVSDNATAKYWFGDMAEIPVFHWHGETFSLPQGATHLLASEHCQHQAYSIGNTLALQCHIEMTPDLVNSWCQHGAAEIAASNSVAVQSPAQILENCNQKCAALQQTADTVYAQWLAKL